MCPGSDSVHGNVFVQQLSTVHGDTIVMTWVVMAISLVCFWLLAASYRGAQVSKRQFVFEGVINYLADLSIGVLGPAGERFVPFFVCLFLYIFLLNQVGFVPLKLMGIPYGGSPTADLNTTVAYAVLVFVMIQVVAIRKRGIGYFKHFAQPFWPLLPLNVIEELARPITLSLRLFFNIFVGEILLFVLTPLSSPGSTSERSIFRSRRHSFRSSFNFSTSSSALFRRSFSRF